MNIKDKDRLTFKNIYKKIHNVELSNDEIDDKGNKLLNIVNFIYNDNLIY